MHWIKIVVAAALTVSGLALVGGCDGTMSGQRPAVESPAALTFEEEGETYVVADGDVAKVTRSGQRQFMVRLYDPEFFAKNYEVEGTDVFRKDPDSGRLYPVSTSFREGFEGVDSTEALFALDRWHQSTADPKRAGKDQDYYNLGNRISLSREVVHEGRTALRLDAMPSSKTVSKASLSKGNMYFKKGDNVGFSGWFYIENTPSVYDGGGVTLFDLESTFLTGSPGMRVIFRINDSLAFELKFPKTQFRQERGSEVPFPTGRWVKVETQMLLSDETGRVRIWQDGRLVLDQNGRTLPLADTIYDRFEVGLSGLTQGAKYKKVVYLDDVAISNAPLRD